MVVYILLGHSNSAPENGLKSGHPLTFRTLSPIPSDTMACVHKRATYEHIEPHAIIGRLPAPSPLEDGGGNIFVLKSRKYLRTFYSADFPPVPKVYR